MTNARRLALCAALAAALTGAALPATASAAPPVPGTEKVSVAPDGADSDRGSVVGGMSANGRYVAFRSQAANLVAGDTNDATDAFVRDLRTGVTSRVSTAADGSQSDGNVEDVSLSADGRHLAFSSTATDLVPGDTGGRWHVYVKDLRTGAVERLDDKQAPGYDTGRQPAISADGRYVAFAASRSEGSSEHDQHARAYRVDRRTGTAVRVSQAPDPGRWRSVTNLSISADGTRVGYQFFVPFPTSGDWSDIYVRDVPSGELWQADKAPDGVVPDAQSEYPSVSADGRYVLFRSLDSRLTPGDTNNGQNMFIRDLKTGFDPTDRRRRPGRVHRVRCPQRRQPPPRLRLGRLRGPRPHTACVCTRPAHRRHHPRQRRHRRGQERRLRDRSGDRRARPQCRLRLLLGRSGAGRHLGQPAHVRTPPAVIGTRQPR
ncbi:TolB family protein [Streptomyces sp. GTA36]